MINRLLSFSFTVEYGSKSILYGVFFMQRFLCLFIVILVVFFLKNKNKKPFEAIYRIGIAVAGLLNWIERYQASLLCFSLCLFPFPRL